MNAEKLDTVRVSVEFYKEYYTLKTQNAELLEALAIALYTLQVIEDSMTPAWDRQTESTKEIWRNKAIRKARGE